MDFLTVMPILGLGGIIWAIVQYFLDSKKDLRIKLNQINEEKYRTILIHMSCGLDYDNRKFFSIKEDYIWNDKYYYLNCVREYYYQSLLYSPDFVITELKKFVENPSQELFVSVAKSMRKDLWSQNTKLDTDELLLKVKDKS